MSFFNSWKEWFKSWKISLPTEDNIVKPKKCIKIDNTGVVVFQDGSVIDIPNTTTEEFNILKTMSEEEIKINYLKVEGKFSLYELNCLKDDFEIKGNDVYFPNINYPLPYDIVGELIYRKNMGDIDNYNRIIKFTLQLLNSPIPNIENVLKFIKKADIKLSKNGNLIVYRRVQKWNYPTNIDKLKEFIIENTLKIKKQKQTTKKYEIFSKNDLFYLTKNSKRFLEDQSFKYEGNLWDLAQRKLIPEEQLYTSSHNSGKYTFTIPGLYKANQLDRTINGVLCSANAGLHCAGRNSYNFNGFGDIEIAALVSPFNSGIIPVSNEGKMTCSEMYIVSKINEGYTVTDKDIEEADNKYFKMNINTLKKVLKSKNLSKLASNTNETPNISLPSMEKIIKQLENRIVKA